MSTLVDDLRELLQEVTRPIMEELGFRTNDLTIVVRTWTEGRIGDPHPAVADVDYTDVSITITPRPKVRTMTLNELNESGGVYQAGDLTADKITPAYPDAEPVVGGYTVAQLSPTILTNGVEVLYVVTGPDAGNYTLVELKRDCALGYALVLRRLNTTPP